MTQASEFYKTAAAQLRNAVQARQLDINELRKSITDKDGEIRKGIHDLQTRIREKEAELYRSQDQQREPEKDRPSKLREVTHMQGVLADMQRDMNKYRADVQSQIAELERDINDTNRLISDLERRT
jgi:chromosome segregation ATPase